VAVERCKPVPPDDNRDMSKAVIRVVAAVIEHDGRYLITQRNATAVLPLLWEFPGGKVEAGESDEEALSREIRHRIGVDVSVGSKVGEHVHHYERYEVHMVMFACALRDGMVPYPATVADLRWVTSREFLDYEFPPADESTLSRLLGLMRN
jgi:8-oxo-dGTP diphosphatase